MNTTLRSRGIHDLRAWPGRAVALGSASLLALGLVVTGPTGPATAIGVPTWTQLSPASSPSARDFPAMTYDAARTEVVLFGGETSYLTPSDETWTWDGATWTQEAPATSPPARYNAALTYDAVRSESVIVGGLTTGGYAGSIDAVDTWTWDGTTWTQETPATSPSGRHLMSMAFDPGPGETVLFGGLNNSGVLGDTWTWDGSAWTLESPTTSPPARSGATMAYDGNTGDLLLFGGYADGTYLTDTWTWDGTTWTQLTPAASPPGRTYASMAYDADLGAVVLFGGYYGSYDHADTWTWDGTTWTVQSPAAHPAARSAAAMAFDAASGQLILFGGWSFAGQVSLGDTWNYAVPLVNPPEAPAAPSLVPGNGQVSVSWSPPADGGSAITSYTVAWKPTSGTVGTTQTVAAPATSTTITGLTNGTSYDFMVRAVNDIGPGEYSPAASATPSTVPSVPTGLQAVAGDRQVALTWSAPFDGGSAITGYTVAFKAIDARKWSTVASSDPAETITGLLNGTQYALKVLATNVNGSSRYSDEIGATPYSPNVPGEPYGLTAVAQPGERTMDVALTWSDTGTGVTDHLVTVYAYRLSKGVPTYREVDALHTGSGATSFTVTGLSPRKLYAFRVAAGNEYGWSAPSGYSDPVGG